MAIIYAAPTDVAAIDPIEVAAHLEEVYRATLQWLEGVSGARAAQPEVDGKWCAKEVVGHLIDSAVNNLDRIVRLETVLDPEPEVRSPGYEQEAWVNAQHYADREWAQLLELWRVLNEHIAWTIRHVDRRKLTRVCVFPASQMTFGFLLEDYVAHMEHHLRLLRKWL